jgi:hypothetical protein
MKTLINGTLYDFSRNTRLEKHTPKKGPEEQQSINQQQQDQATQNAAYGNVNSTDANFAGPTQNTPYYKAMVASTADSTSNAYQNAQANATQSAQQAGFGQSSPIGQAASREVTGAEAAQQAQIPAEAMQATAPLQLQAAGQQLNEGTAAGQQGLGYENIAANQNTAYQNRRQSFNNSLMGAGLGAASNIWNTNPYGMFGQQ